MFIRIPLELIGVNCLVRAGHDCCECIVKIMKNNNASGAAGVLLSLDMLQTDSTPMLSFDVVDRTMIVAVGEERRGGRQPRR